MVPIKILLVDDNADVREITALLLSDLGYVVVEAPSGPAALELLRTGPGVDLLIVDFAMPGMSGVELLAKARDINPSLKAIFITGYADHSRFEQDFGNEIVVCKPFTMEQLEPAVRRRLGLG